MKVCMFVLDNCKYDTRVLREAKTLTNAGYEVRIIATLDKKTKAYEEKDGFRIIRVRADPLHRRLLRVLGEGDPFSIRFTVGLLSRGFEWAYRTKQKFVQSPHRVKKLPPLSPPQSGRASLPVSHEVKQPTRSVLYRVEQRILRSLVLNDRYARRVLYKGLKSVFRPFDELLLYRDYYHKSWEATKGEPADIYHCNDLSTLPAGYVARRRTGGKLIYDSHELFAELHYIPRAEKPIFRMREKSLIHRADAVITVNEFIAKELSKRYGISLPIVVRNCPPLARQDDEQCENSLRKSLGLDETVPVIVHVGMFSSSRGSEKLISAVPFLKDGVLVFLGWGASAREDNLREVVSRRGLADRILFAPPVEPEQVVGHISSAQVGVVLFRNFGLNHYYATPNKLWECMNAGLPVVACNFPAITSIIEGYSLGRTCDPEDPEDIAAAINWVLADKQRYRQMKRNALEAVKVYNWENESAKLLQVYGELG